MKPPISAVIITRNEECRIVSCIESLKSAVEEVVVIDSQSDDKTCEYAKAVGAKVFIREWKGYGFNKNLGNQLAKNSWILSIDADESLSPQLASAIQEVNLDKYSAYSVKRVSIINDKKIRWGTFHPQWKLRLFNKNKWCWDDKLVHENLISDHPEQQVRLAGNLFHEMGSNFDRLKRRAENYAEISANQWIRNGIETSLLKNLFSPSYHFIRSYIFQLGFLEGKLGWDTSWLQCYQAKKKIEFFQSFKSR